MENDTGEALRPDNVWRRHNKVCTTRNQNCDHEKSIRVVDSPTILEWWQEKIFTIFDCE